MSTVVTVTKSKNPTPTLRMSLLATPHWRRHDDDDGSEFQFAEHSGEQFSNAAERKVYSTVRRLGKGSGGTAFAAVVGKFTREQTARMPPTHVLKIYERKRGETLEQLGERARYEYDISRFLESAGRVRHDGLCGRDVVCASEFFVDADAKAGVLVFPFENAIDLQTFMQRELYNSYDPRHAKAYKEQVLEIANLLFTAVHRMNAVGMYHRDIKPENIIVSFGYPADVEDVVPRVRSLKFIDFELSCALVEPALLLALERRAARKKQPLRLDALSCALPGSGGERFVYFCDQSFRDPLSGVGEPSQPQEARFQFTREQARERWRFFEMFSCAIVVQLLADPDQNRIVMAGGSGGGGGNKSVVPAVVETERMPEGLVSMLKEMTGPLEKRRSLADYGVQINYLLDALE